MLSKIKWAINHLDTEVKLFGLYILLIVYMIYGTGIVSDDFAHLAGSVKKVYFVRPLFKYLYSIYYSLIDLNQLALIYFLKIFQTVLIFYMTFFDVS